MAFFPNFNVKYAQTIYPAADLSEQISLAGKEASGTGNMKFAFNGAVTIGTLDGANVEIRDEVGADNFFLFGITADDVRRCKEAGYRPRDFYETRRGEIRSRSRLHRIRRPFAGRSASIRTARSITVGSPTSIWWLADFGAYVECQNAVSAAYRDPGTLDQMSIRNVARIGKFSSDRAIREFCRDIWRIDPLVIPTESRRTYPLVGTEVLRAIIVRSDFRCSESRAWF